MVLYAAFNTYMDMTVLYVLEIIRELKGHIGPFESDCTGRLSNPLTERSTKH